MTKNNSLSLLMMGIHLPTLGRIKHWEDQGALSLIGIWDPFYAEEAQEYERVPIIGTEELIDQPIHLIFLANQEVPYIEQAKQLKKSHTVFLNMDQFWLLEQWMEQKIQLQNLFKDEQLFQTILKYSHEGIQFVDAQGMIQYINPAFSRITNISAEERLGKSIYEVSPEGALVQALETLTPVIGFRTDVVGSGVEVISNAAPIFADGELAGAVTTFQDVTEIKHLSQQLRDRDHEITKLNDRLRDIHAPYYSFRDIIGETESIKRAIEIAKKAARTRSTIVITGESGTGKELFAHSIHAESDFSQKPFVIVNCAAIPEALLESELFGFEKGAFTNAVKQKIGKIELAHEGTLFLDEIGDMSLPLQAKLLRVLQSKEFERVGGLTPIHVQVRIIAATNHDLQQLVSEGQFRADLFYRLNVVQIEIPPLRDRIQDLPLLVDQLMKRISLRIGLSPMTLTNKGMGLLADHSWPGNIRELENFLERLMNESPSSVIPDALVQRLLPQGSEGITANDIPSNESQVMPLRFVEREHLARALDLYGRTLAGKKKAARALGISLATLYNKIKDYHLT